MIRHKCMYRKVVDDVDQRRTAEENHVNARHDGGHGVVIRLVERLEYILLVQAPTFVPDRPTG